jgi:hypothetical protein
VENYFNYFTEIEEHFQRRRGTLLLLSTLDWALIETWKDAGIPLEAVLRGIEETFEHYDLRPSKVRKVNSLAYCSQAVLTAAEDMKEAAVGAAFDIKAEKGIERSDVADYFRRNSATLAERVANLPPGAQGVARDCAASLAELAPEVEKMTAERPTISLEDLERRLTVMEERLFAALLASVSDDELLKVRTEADRDLAPYRSKMPTAQVQQLHKQYCNKRLLEKYDLPRLSLFYM